jgi:protoporphyrinogen oxidase
METDGGCFHSYLYDCYAREVWDDPDASIKTGAVQALLEEFPEYAGRVMDVDIARWRYGLPVYSPGRMKRQAALEASVDGIHFAGDYVFRSNMEGAVQSADAAAARVLDGSAR